MTSFINSINVEVPETVPRLHTSTETKDINQQKQQQQLSSYVVEVKTNDNDNTDPPSAGTCSHFTSSFGKANVLQALEDTQVSYMVQNQRDLIFRRKTIQVPGIRSTLMRESVPDVFNIDNETSMAFLFLFLGSTLCAPLLCINWIFANSPNKRTRSLARLSICLSCPLTLFLATTLLSLFISTNTTSLSDLVERTVMDVTCQQGAYCCAAKGSLERYVDMCAEAGVVDPTGRMCRYKFAPCYWNNGTVQNTTTIHCHGLLSDKKTICHKHRAQHVNGKEPGEL